MAKNTMTRNIPLEAVCDLTNQQGVANYEGFKAKNSFFMNGRLCPWWRRKADDGYLTGGLSYRANDDSFSIMKDGKEVMEISRTRYSVEKCESLPALSSCPNPYPDGDDYAWSEYPGISYSNMKNDGFIFGFEYNGLPATLVTAKEQSGGYKCYFFQGKKCLGRWRTPNRINVIAKVSDSEHPRSMTSYGFPDFPLGLVWTSWEESAFEKFKGDGRGAPPVGQCGTFFLKKDNSFLNLAGEIIPDNRDLSHQGWNKTSESTTPGGYVLPGDLPIIDAGLEEVGSGSTSTSTEISPLMFAVGWNKVIIGEVFEGIVEDSLRWNYLVTIAGLSSYDYSWCYTRDFHKEGTYTCTPTSAECELYTIKWGTTTGGVDYGKFEDLSNSFSKNSVHRIESCSTLHPENYSKKFGEFAINYVKNQEYSIGHGYKKILQLDEEEILGYTEDSIYYEKDGVNYRLFMERCDRPQFTVLDDDCVVFNTTTYNNAYHLIFDTVFCSSDDWNNRAQWYVTEYSENWRMLNSRLNQDWQTRKKILSVSTQFSSITQRLATRTETVNGEEQLFSDPTKMNVFYIDDSYTCPEGVEYDVFFESAITSSVKEKGGALEKQGTLSASGFTVEKDEGMIFSEPGTDENQENIPVLGFSFTSFNGSVLVKVGDFAYMCLKQPMLGNTFVPLYQMSETGYSATTYIQFAINGQLFSYYPKTSQIIDSNDQFVCDTSTFVYLGYSSRCAYFYCLMDKSVYTFTGDNTMNRLYPIERLTLQLASVSELDKETKVGDTLNIPSLDFVVVNFKTGFGVLYDSQFCLVPTDKEISSGTMTVDKNNAAVNVNGTNYSLISQDGYESVPIEFETQFYGDASGESNMVNDAVYFELTNYNGKSEGKITVQTVALVNGTVKEGAKKTISVGKSDFNKAGVARVRYQPDIQECRGFKLKVVSDFEVASMKIGCEAGALAQPKVRM